MILKFEDIEVSHMPEFKGGEMELAANMFFDGTNRIFKGCLVPGASIGVHTHEDSLEVIFIISGTGSLYETAPGAKDGSGTLTKVSQGDCLYCPKGHTHSLMNPAESSDDLIFYAVVAQQ